MSTPAQKANLARIRDNQRRSRARRREYLQELEQRLRVYELQGVEASAEVQLAARRVAEENRQLRLLLNRQGISDEYIMGFINSGAAAHSEPSPVTPFGTVIPSESVQSLQHLIVPRRPALIDAGVNYTVPPQESREASIASVSTNSSSLWDSPQPSLNPSYARALPSTIPHPTIGRSSIPVQVQVSPHPYSQQIFSNTSTPRANAYTPDTQNHAPIIEDPRQQGYAIAALPSDANPAIAYQTHMHLNPYPHGTQDPNHQGDC